MTLPGPGGDEPRDEARLGEQLRAAEEKLAGAQRELEAARAVGSALALAITRVDDNLRPAIKWDLVRRLSRKALAHLETSDPAPAESAPIEFFIGFKQKDGSYRYAVADEPDFNLNGYVNAATLKYHDGSGPKEPDDALELLAHRGCYLWLHVYADGTPFLILKDDPSSNRGEWSGPRYGGATVGAAAAKLVASLPQAHRDGLLASRRASTKWKLANSPEEDFPPFGVDPGDSAALFKLRSAIDDADLWPSRSIQEAGDYEASVAFMARVARPALEATERASREDAEPKPPAPLPNPLRAGLTFRIVGRRDHISDVWEVEAVEPRSAWVPKVGDRVRAPGAACAGTITRITDGDRLNIWVTFDNDASCNHDAADLTPVPPLTAELLVRALDEVAGVPGYGGTGHYVLRLLADKLRERAGLPSPDLYT